MGEGIRQTSTYSNKQKIEYVYLSHSSFSRDEGCKRSSISTSDSAQTLAQSP